MLNFTVLDQKQIVLEKIKFLNDYKVAAITDFAILLGGIKSEVCLTKDNLEAGNYWINASYKSYPMYVDVIGGLI